MEKSLLWELLGTFTVVEKRRAVKFLESPYCNPKEDATLLFRQLMICQRKGIAPDRQQLFVTIYPGALFDAQSFRLLQSHLLKCLERFVSWEHFEAKANQADLFLMQSLRERNLHRHLKRSLNKQVVTQYEQPENHLLAYHRERERYAFLAKETRDLKLNLQQTEDALDDAFVAFKLRQACFTRSHESVSRTRYEIRFLEPLLDYAAISDQPVLQIYRNCYLALFYEPTDENFRRFKDSLFEIESDLPPQEIRSLFISALNFCIRKINENSQFYLQEGFDLYVNGLKNKALLENNEISRFTFNNLVGIAIKLEEWVFVEDFINEYTDYLPQTWRAPTVALGRARLAYAQKAYDDALVHLRGTDHRDLITNMTGKILQAKIYYDNDQRDLLDHHLYSLQRFLERNKKMAYHHENWTNVIRYFRKLNEVNQFDDEELAVLRIAIGNEEILTEKEWLLARINIA